jgi:predicted GNAT superfamily acetyltransferase
MFWTFDPLVARNAHFNINKLGARPVEYVVDMYGSQTGSTLHGAVPTDRLVIAWDLADPRPMSRHAERTHEGDALLPLANPVDSRPLPVGAQTVKVQVPRSPSDLPDEATRLKWRLNVRAAMIPLFDAGYVVQRFVRSTADGALPYYVLARP